jgi:hypothetical protein
MVYDPIISLESLFSLLKSNASLSLLLNNSTLSDAVALASTKKLASSSRITGLSIYYRITVLLFKLY